MPDVDGTSVCWEIREVSEVPVLFLSAYADTEDRIRGLLAGGDDYMGKPYSLEELELRLRRHIERRQKRESREVLSFGELCIDRVFSYEQLYDRVWKSPLNQGLHNMQVCMARVRQKLARLCPDGNYIETVRRKGYRFLPE